MATQTVIEGVEGFEKKESLSIRTPQQLIELAIAQGANAEQLGKLFEIQLKWEANEKKKAYDAAWSIFKDNPPDISKTKLVSYANRDGSKTEYRHAELDKASKIIAEALKAVGLSHSWRTGEGENARTKVTCVIKHKLGHEEEVSTLCGPPESSGAKNNVQAIGSTVFYLERYTLFAGTGIVPEGVDLDAKDVDGLPEDSILDYSTKMQDCANFEELKAVFKECFTKAGNLKDLDAQKRLTKVYESRKREIFQRNNQ